MLNVYSQIRRSMRGRLITIISIIGVLLFLCTIFFVGSFHAQNISDQVREKLGVYLYLDDSPEKESLVTAQALDMVEELGGLGIQSQFYTKEDAFVVLEKKLPEVTADLEKYGISNPLPPTLYIIFDNETERGQIKDTVLKYQDIVQNTQDLDTTGFSFSEQERRVIDVLNVVSVARTSILFLLVVLGSIVMIMILLLLESIFNRLYADVEVKVLSGIPFRRISMPFLAIGLSVFIMGFLAQAGLLYSIYRIIAQYIQRIFQSNAFDILFPQTMFVYEGGVFIIGIMLCLVAGMLLLTRRMRRLRG